MITAKNIVDLLLNKHSSDKWISVPECKIGSTWFKTNCQRFDMWTMAKSYANPRFIGYEIKVNRQDFLRDDKWIGYLDYCREFYFVAPPGIIDKTEVPEQAGLLVSSKNAKVLYTKKKAPVRDIEIPVSIFHYILMSRSVICNEYNHQSSKLERWRKFLKTKDEHKKLGCEVASKINRLVSKQVGKIEKENRDLKNENYNLQKAKEIIERLGFDGNIYLNSNKLERAIITAQTGIPEGLIRLTRNTSEALMKLANLLDSKDNIGN